MIFLVCDKKVEAVCVELKDLKSRAGHKKILKGKLSAKEGQREALLKQLRPGKLNFNVTLGSRYPNSDNEYDSLSEQTTITRYRNSDSEYGRLYSLSEFR